jgi:hypothetical protein
MAKSQNGQRNGARHPSRSFRFDAIRSRLRGSERKTDKAGAPIITEGADGHSGRRFVVIAVVVVLLIWGGLYLVFYRWRTDYRGRVAYGLSNVVPAVDAFEEVTPPHVDPVAWRNAVDKTRAMLRTVVGSNLLDRRDMDELRRELDTRVNSAQSHPESATTELAAIWNEMADRAEFLFQDSRAPTHDRHIRPRILPPKPERQKTPAPRSASPPPTKSPTNPGIAPS